MLGFRLDEGETPHSLREFRVFDIEYADKSTGTVTLAVRGFFTDDDGKAFQEMLKSLSQVISSHMPPELRPEAVLNAEQVFGLFHSDGRIEVWINESKFRISTRVRGAVNEGDPATLGQISDVQMAKFKDVDIPAGCGFVAYLSFHNNHALVFDVRPSSDESPEGSADHEALLGAAFTYLFFRERISMSASEWEAMFEQCWFPFVSLDPDTVGIMIACLRADTLIDSQLTSIGASVRSQLPEMRNFFLTHIVFERHRTLLLQALAAYERGEYAIALTALLPRTEGMLREIYARNEKTKKATDARLLDRIASHATRNPLSLLEPGRFSKYIEAVLFAYEDFKDPAAIRKVTRHSIAHGVADSQLMDEKFATIALLSIYQIGVLASEVA